MIKQCLEDKTDKRTDRQELATDTHATATPMHHTKLTLQGVSSRPPPGLPEETPSLAYHFQRLVPIFPQLLFSFRLFF